jgi:hypothetical protein
MHHAYVQNCIFLTLKPKMSSYFRRRYYGFMEWQMGWSYLKQDMLGVHF